MPGFGAFSEEEYRKLYEEGQSKRAFPLLISAGQVFRSFQRYCREALPYRERVENDPTANMETLFCIAEAMDEAGYEPAFPLLPRDPASSRALEDRVQLTTGFLLSQIQMWLWEVYINLPPLDRKRRQDLKDHVPAYERFLQLLNKYAFRTRVTVLTTNYDILFEFFSWAVEGGHSCAYPLRHHWDHMDIEACEEQAAPYHGNVGYIHEWEHEPDALLVCKLHGSANFFELKTDGGARLAICTDMATTDDKVGNSGIPPIPRPQGSRIDARKCNERPAILAQDAIWSLRKRFGDSLVPAIVPPTYAKLKGQPWIRRIWGSAFRAISTAKVILFIGYSFPPSDGFMRAMFQAALAARGKRSQPEVHLFDANPGHNADENRVYQEELERRYCEVFPDLEALTRDDWLHALTFADAMQASEIEKIISRVVDSAPGHGE